LPSVLGDQSPLEKTPEPKTDDRLELGRVRDPERRRECDADEVEAGAGGMRTEGKGWSRGVVGPEPGSDAAPPCAAVGRRRLSAAPRRERRLDDADDARNVDGSVPARGRPDRANCDGVVATGCDGPCSWTVGRRSDESGDECRWT